MAEAKFVTAINCMDGRVQLPVIEFLKKKYKADYVDVITEPGPIKILSDNLNNTLVESIKHRVTISIEKHGSKVIAVAGHFDCAGNPVDKDTQLNQLDAAVKIIAGWNFDVEPIRLWVDENWQVHPI